MDIKDLIDYLLGKFKFERYVSRVLTVFSTIILIGLIIYNIYNGTDLLTIVPLLGPSGVMAYASSNTLKMWNDCTALATKYIENVNK